jgi:DNA-binding response OmpR family regulator
MPEKILLADDDKTLRDAAARYLEGKGYAVVKAESGTSAAVLAGAERPDLIITDAEMAGLDGFALCRAVKETPGLTHTPVIIISGRKISDEDIVEGYGRGADDYILKPISLPVLLVKIKAVLRRYEAFRGEAGRIARYGMVVDPSARTVTVDGAAAHLTRKEFDLLTALLGAEGRVLSVSHLLDSVWGYDPAMYNDPHTVGVHVSSLRKKLGHEIGAHIVSVTGHGYKFE